MQTWYVQVTINLFNVFNFTCNITHQTVMTDMGIQTPSL